MSHHAVAVGECGMKRKLSRIFFFYYRFHRFYFLSIRVAFAFTQFRHKYFYQLRNIAVLVDSLLSFFLYLNVIVSLWLLITSGYHRLLVLIMMLVANVIFIWLIQKERKERRRITLKPFSIYDINIGSAKILTGDVLLLHLFIDSRKKKWNEERITKVMRCVDDALSWIKSQAEQFKIDVSIENKIIPSSKARFRKAIPETANKFRHMDEFQYLIKSILEKFDLSKLQKEPGENRNICLFVHVLKRIRSYAVPDFLGKKDDGMKLEYCVIADESGPSVYAHELLHLFGANDYYSEHSKTVQKLRAEFIARSIMFYGGRWTLDHLVIDGLTAQNIGWL